MRKRGFTLIELLVVIAIIAILAAVLFPVIMGVKEKARQSSCSSNLKQITMAILMYAQNHNGRAPLYWDGIPHSSGNSQDYHWWCSGAIRPYFAGGKLMLAEALKCPSMKGIQWVYMMSQQYPNLKAISGKASVGILGLPAAAFGASNACPGRSLDALRPKQALIIEGKGGGVKAFWADPFANTDMQKPDYLIGPSNRHNGGCNISFPDGHVQWIKTSEIISPEKWPIIAGQVGS